MELLKGVKQDLNNPIPVMGIEASPELFTEDSQANYLRTAECAYYKAEARGFEPGHEIQDWLEAEAEMIN